jgi:hypothetical protein
MFILVTLFGIEIRNIKKVIPILKRQLKRFFSDLELDKDLDWETIKCLEESTVIRKNVKLVEGFNLPRLSSPLGIRKCSPSGLEIQAHCQNTMMPAAYSTNPSRLIMQRMETQNVLIQKLLGKKRQRNGQVLLEINFHLLWLVRIGLLNHG